MINLADVERRVANHALAKAVDQLPKGHVRIETAFLYPDGGSVDVFLVNDSAKLSDLGQTISWLSDVQVKPWVSKKRQRFLEDALRIYGVKQQGGALERAIRSLDELVEGIVLLGQACVRVADLAYTRRSSLQSTFLEQVEEVIADAAVPYEANAELSGRYGNLIRVDFLTQGQRHQSAVLTLASGNASQAHVQANEVFRKWHDLDSPDRHEQRVTIFDDSSNVYREDDMKRLKEMSDLVALSDKQTVVDLLAA